MKRFVQVTSGKGSHMDVYQRKDLQTVGAGLLIALLAGVIGITWFVSGSDDRTAEATIVSKERSVVYDRQVTYRYTAGGQEHTGDAEYDDKDVPKALRGKGVGDTVTVCYDPGSPDSASLGSCGGSRVLSAVLGFGVAPLALLGSLYVAWGMRKRAPA